MLLLVASATGTPAAAQEGVTAPRIASIGGSITEIIYVVCIQVLLVV